MTQGEHPASRAAVGEHHACSPSLPVPSKPASWHDIPWREMSMRGFVAFFDLAAVQLQLQEACETAVWDEGEEK